MLPCPQCLEENNRSIKERGYGYGYMGNNLQCQRHKSTTSITPATTAPITNWQPHYFEYKNSAPSRKKSNGL